MLTYKPRLVFTKGRFFYWVVTQKCKNTSLRAKKKKVFVFLKILFCFGVEHTTNSLFHLDKRRTLIDYTTTR